MRRELMEILACPVCKGELTLTAIAAEADEVVTGTLHCERCSEDYPIEDGIPNLLPPEMRRAMAAEAGQRAPGAHP